MRGPERGKPGRWSAGAEPTIHLILSSRAFSCSLGGGLDVRKEKIVIVLISYLRDFPLQAFARFGNSSLGGFILVHWDFSLGTTSGRRVKLKCRIANELPGTIPWGAYPVDESARMNQAQAGRKRAGKTRNPPPFPDQSSTPDAAQLAEVAAKEQNTSRCPAEWQSGTSSIWRD